MYKKLENELIIERAMTAFDCKTQAQLADILNITPQNLSNLKIKGTLIKKIEKEAYKRNKNINWIKTGEGEMSIEPATSADINKNVKNEHHTPYPDPNLPALQKTSEVLETDSIFRKALNSNIEAFHEAIKLRKELNITKLQLGQCENKIDQQQNEIEELKRQVKLLNDKLLVIESA